MAAWLIVENGKRHLFVGGCCAINFYNKDRDHRTAPDIVEPMDGEAVEDCDHV